MTSVSVIIPTYNRCELVQKAIDSVLAQTYLDFELIVIDDGSIDETPQVIPLKYGERICYIWQENAGESAARNRGIQQAQGEFIAFLDSDDTWHADKLEKQVNTLLQQPEIGGIVCQGELIDKDGQLIAQPLRYTNLTSADLIAEKLVLGNDPTISTTLVIRKSIIECIGGFAENIHYGEDADFCLRASLNCKLDIYPEVLVQIRVHLSSQTSLLSKEKAIQWYQDHQTIMERIKQQSNQPELQTAIRKAEARNDIAAAMAFLGTQNLEQAREILGGSHRRTGEVVPFDIYCAHAGVVLNQVYHSADGQNSARQFINDLYDLGVEAQYYPLDQLQKVRARQFSLLAIWLWKDKVRIPALTNLLKAAFYSPVVAYHSVRPQKR